MVHPLRGLLWPVGMAIALQVSRTESFCYKTRIFATPNTFIAYDGPRSALVAGAAPPLRNARNVAATIVQSKIVPDDVESLTALQIKQLRKETEQRRAWRNLKTIAFEDYEADDEQSYADLIHDLSSELEADCMVELRGISKNSRRNVYSIAEEIAEDAGEIRSTFLVTVKGHAAVFFSPAETIALRTTRKKNQWTKRSKAERDSRGQIVREAEEED